MDPEEKYNDKPKKPGGMDLIRINALQLEHTSSNFPTPKASKEAIAPPLNRWKSIKDDSKSSKPKLNRWKSAKDVDLSHMATGQHKIVFLTTTYDPNIDVDKEASDIQSVEDFDFTRLLLTFSNLESVLSEPPPIIHISTHGFHQYKAFNKQTAFQIALEEPQTLRYLIDSHPKFSAIFAVIAILFEQEIHHFVQYGFTKRKKIMKDNKMLKTWIWRDENKFALLCNIKIYKMLTCILDRYGCFYRENEKKKCVEIFWGKYENKFGANRNDLQFIKPPHPPNILYTFSDIYKHDTCVQNILKNINDDYNKSVRQNIKIVKALRKYQKFSWAILGILMHQILIKENIQLDEIDDTQWDDSNNNSATNNESKSNTPILEDIEMDDDDDDEYDSEWAAFMAEDSEVEDEELTTSGLQTELKFGLNQELTREIFIDVSNQSEKLEAKRDAIKMQKLIKKLSRLKKKLIIRLYSTSDIRIRWHFASSASSNVHIIRFSDEYSLLEAKKLIDYIRSEPEYSHEYDIKFRAISKSLSLTKKQVGYISATQEKIFSIDIENKTDPISQMLREKLINKKLCRIKLLILNGCHSFILGKIFSEYVENVICVHPFVKILDRTATTFTKFFYQSLQHCLHPRIPFSHSVLKAYNISKTNVAKECSNDFACASHSHNQHTSNINNQHNKYINNIQQIKRRVEQFNTLHFNEHWNNLQHHINDENLFQTYRNKMKLTGVIMEEPIDDLYDGKTLIILNINSNEMYLLKNYLEKEYYLLNPNQTEDFVKDFYYQINEYFPELSVAYFKFKNIKHSKNAKEILSQKQYDEELIFSDKILLKSHEFKDDNKYDNEDDENENENENNLGWIYRTVPRCCCSPMYPHIVQDKLILLQNGKIINRKIIHNIQQIKNGLQKMKIRNNKIKHAVSKNKLVQTSMTDINIVKTYSAKDDMKDDEEKKYNNMNHSFEEKNNNFHLNVKHKNNFQKKNSFNNFGTKNCNNFGDGNGKRKSNNFGTGNNFGDAKYKKTNFFKSTKNVLFIENKNDNENKLNENKLNENKLNEFNENKLEFNEYENVKFRSNQNNNTNNFGNTTTTRNNFGSGNKTSKKNNFNSKKTVTFNDVNRGSVQPFTEQISNISESSTMTNTSICSNIFPLTSDNSNEQLQLLLEYDTILPN